MNWRIRGLTWVDKPYITTRYILQYTLLCITLLLISKHYPFSIVCCVYGCSWLFYNYNQILYTDERLLWEQSRFLKGLTWKACYTTIPYRDYVWFQTPYFTYILTYITTRILYRICTIIITLCTVWCISYEGYPHLALSILLSPLFWMMCGSVSHDIWAWNLCIHSFLWNINNIAKLFFFCLSITIKPLYIILFPIYFLLIGSLSCIILLYIAILIYIWKDTYYFKKYIKHLWKYIQHSIQQSYIRHTTQKSLFYRGQHMKKWLYMYSIVIYLFPVIYMGNIWFYFCVSLFYYFRLQPKYYLMLYVILFI